MCFASAEWVRCLEGKTLFSMRFQCLEIQIQLKYKLDGCGRGSLLKDNCLGKCFPASTQERTPQQWLEAARLRFQLATELAPLVHLGLAFQEF